MADKILKEKRRLFVRSVAIGTINGLLDELLETRVLNQEEVEIVRGENATVMDKARALIDSVIRKGPQACQICINHICGDDPHLAGVLELSTGSQFGKYLNVQESQAVVPPFPAPQTVQDNPVKPASSEPRGSLKLCPPDIAQRLWKEKSAEIYPIMEKSIRTRLALIICNTEFENLPRRDGADVDIRDMKILLEDLGYSVDVRENLTASDMAIELKAFAARPEHKSSDSTFLVLMSHGIQAGICGKKYSEKVPDVLEVNTIFQILNTLNCPNLKDKPKVIIIQACRGEKQGVVWIKDSVEASGNSSLLAAEDFECDAIKKAHIEKDFIAFCSSTPDNVSWRHPLLGSLFIIKLIKILQEHAWSCDLEEIFRKVRFSFELADGRAQMPTAERVTLTRSFYLFPGY
ncbi:caspase-1 [Phacochoerus africanus]|uniref:caspase-1 n=1 Tax=Phacochoerus africanus TaxID=41426 RepID=UPI001FDA460F|nr:caspase-1 [Phacochoerus africanus]